MKIPTPKMSEILAEEFMESFGLSAYALSKQIGVPTSRTQAILHDRRKVTVDTSIRLGRFFNVSPRYFLNLQNDLDVREAEAESHDEYAEIVPFETAHQA